MGVRLVIKLALGSGLLSTAEVFSTQLRRVPVQRSTVFSVRHPGCGPARRGVRLAVSSTLGILAACFSTIEDLSILRAHVTKFGMLMFSR